VRRTRARWIAALGLALLAVSLPGCGGDDSIGGTGETPSHTGTGSTTSSTGGGTTGQNGTGQNGTGPRVGSVTKVNQADAFIEGATAFQDDPIHAGQTISTDDSGIVTFGLDEKIDNCRLFQASNVAAVPEGGVLLRWEAGVAWCTTTANGSTATALGPSDVRFEMSDPLFGVVVQEQDVTLRVQQGIVDVSSPGSGPLLVGPGQQVTVVAGVVPSVAEDFNTEDLPQAERDTVSEFENALPRPDLGPPDPGDSAGLQRILVTDHAIAVGIDSRFAGNPIEQTDTTEWRFADDFFILLGENWGTDSNPLAMEPSQAGPALESGELDVFVTPEPLPGSGSFPLFGDPEGRTWSVSFISGDARLGQELGEFVVATLQDKTYAITYQSAFEKEDPPYEPLRPLLGL